MIIRIKTSKGEEVARALAMIELGTRQVYIGVIFNIPDEPGMQEFIYSTDGKWTIDDGKSVDRDRFRPHPVQKRRKSH